jgi:hypothetical protein
MVKKTRRRLSVRWTSVYWAKFKKRCRRWPRTQKMAKNAEDGQEFIKEDGTNKPKEERLTP